MIRKTSPQAPFKPPASPIQAPFKKHESPAAKPGFRLFRSPVRRGRFRVRQSPQLPVVQVPSGVHVVQIVPSLTTTFPPFSVTVAFAGSPPPPVNDW